MNVFKKILPLTILLISVSSILQWCSLPIGNTAVWWVIQAIILLCFWRLRPKAYKIWQINIFLMLLIFEALYGAMFMAENYWDWKMLISNLMIFSLPIASYTFANSRLMSRVLRFWFRYAWVLFVILFSSLESDAIGRYLMPYSFLMLFFAPLTLKYKFITLLVYVVVIIYGSDSRSDLLKFTSSFALGLSTLFNKVLKRFAVFKWGSVVLYIAPVLLFILGLFGVFNIFQIEGELDLGRDKYTMQSSSGEEMSVLADTRTFLYEEHINSAIKNDYMFYGRSLARGCDSPSFGEQCDSAKRAVDPTYIGRGERPSSEVSIHNIFNYFGIVGIFVYFLIFWGASWRAIYRSNNIYTPIVGVYVAFRWAFAWIEDFSRFDLNYLFIWIMIGMCYSPVFRGMTNREFKGWLRGVM